MGTFLRRGLPLSLLILTLVLSALLTMVVAAFLREYAETWRSGALQGLRFALLPAVVLIVLAVAAAAILRTRLAMGLLAGVVILAVAGPAVAGQWAAGAKEAAQPSRATCVIEGSVYFEEGDPREEKAQSDVARAQAAFDSLDHPAPFLGGGGSGTGWCGQNLAMTDLPAALAFYREELPSAGWTVVEDSDDRLVATSDGLTLTVSADHLVLLDLRVQ